MSYFVIIFVMCELLVNVEFYDAFGSLAFMVPLIVETFSVVSHLLIWLPGSV